MKTQIKPYRHKVQYYETDQMAIVHHSNYIRWFEEARVDYMDQMGYGYKRMEEEGIVSPVISVQAEYKSMTRFGETVGIEVKVLQFNGVKLTLGYHIYDSETNELRCQGNSEHCFIDKEGKFVSVKRAKPEFYQCMKNTIEI
ncbi:MAG: acyl-CoA thioesterase [Lachnospiraceae bacterium]|nr:acyl-CoA thioesterase [Lachnospiraceae bacterium]